ncbi:type II secretion system protein, partial [bacterium]
MRRFETFGTKKIGRRAGFCNMDLYVSMGIIVVLAAILFPIFGRARQNVRRSQCQSHLKLIAMAVRQYAQEHDDYFPLAISQKGDRGWA